MRSLPHPLLIATALACASLTTACAVDDTGTRDALDRMSAVATTDVAVVDNDFEPAVITVEPGATVTWDWAGDNKHDVTGDGFSSDVQRTGEFTYTFDEVGRFTYTCRLHGGMEGVVVVEGS